MVPLSLSIRCLSLTALLIGIGCDSAERRDPLSSHTLHENSDASSGQSLSQYSAPTESPIANSEPSITDELPKRNQPVTAAMFCENASERSSTVSGVNQSSRRTNAAWLVAEEVRLRPTRFFCSWALGMSMEILVDFDLGIRYY